MRIAWFTHRYYPCIGGAENFGRAMVRRFAAGGAGADVITTDAHDLWYFIDRRRRRVEAPGEETMDGARVRRLRVRHVPAQRYVTKLLSYAPHWPTRCRVGSYMPIVPGLTRVRGPFDAVFAVGFPFTVFAHAALGAARAAGAPLVLAPFLHLATPGDPVHRAYTRPHQVRLLREADLVVVVTRLEADAVAGFGIRRDRILKLTMGVEHAEVTGGDRRQFRDRLGIPPGAAVVGQLGANDPNKGTVDLVRAVALRNSRRPAGDPVHLVLAGAISPAFAAFLADLPPETARWLHVRGEIPEAESRHFYAALDVFAMPSRTDSFGIVFLEAWANGLPVVAARAGGVAEVVEHERTGLLVPFGEPETLAAALGRLLTEPALARRLGEAGRTLVQSPRFTWDDCFATLSARVRETIAAGRRPLDRAG